MGRTRHGRQPPGSSGSDREGSVPTQKSLRRRAPLALAGVALAVTVAVVASIVLRPRQEGPLRYDGSAGIVTPQAPGQTFTWTMPLPPNPTRETIYLRSLEPVGSRGLTVLGVDVAYGCGIPSTAREYPIPGLVTRSVDGAVLPVTDDGCSLPSAVIGLRRVAGEGGIDGLRLRYQSRDTEYETVLAFQVVVSDP